MFVAIMWAVKLVEVGFNTSFVDFGLLPRTSEGLMGLITMPVIHADFNHLMSNSLPILILGTGIFYFYREVALKVVLWIYILGGVWVWVAARGSYHIGASGLVYGFATFLFISGLLRRNRNLMAISFLVAFFYGGLTWDVLPIRPSISWEGHLFGSIAGLVCAVYYKDIGREEELQEEDRDDDDDDDSGLPWRQEEHLNYGSYWTYRNWTGGPPRT
jgi:membrane associated rhomboid family serine protease